MFCFVKANNDFRDIEPRAAFASLQLVFVYL